MKTKTILRTIGGLIAWLVSFQFIGVGTYLMNQPSNISFTFGIVCYGLIVVSIFICAYKFSQAAVQLVTEYRESREIKQEEPRQELGGIPKGTVNMVIGKNKQDKKEEL
jgi:hypothetical protein